MHIVAVERREFLTNYIQSVGLPVKVGNKLVQFHDLEFEFSSSFGISGGVISHSLCQTGSWSIVKILTYFFQGSNSCEPELEGSCTSSLIDSQVFHDAKLGFGP